MNIVNENTSTSEKENERWQLIIFKRLLHNNEMRLMNAINDIHRFMSTQHSLTYVYAVR